MLDPCGAIRAIADDLTAGVPVGAIAGRFHEGVARATARACIEAAERHGLEVAVLSGGVFQNRLLLERTAELLGRQVCDRSCPSGYRRTTAASPTGRRRWRPRAILT